MTNSFALSIADRIATELKAQGRTQQQLAAYLGIAQPNVSKRFRGVTPFTLDDMPKVARFLGITVEALVEGRGAENSGQHTVSPTPTPQTGELGSRERLDRPAAPSTVDQGGVVSASMIAEQERETARGGVA